MDRPLEPRPVSRPAATRRRGGAWSFTAAAVAAVVLSLAGCSGGDRGEASEDDPRQEPATQSPALAEGNEGNEADEGVGPSGGDPLDGGR